MSGGARHAGNQQRPLPGFSLFAVPRFVVSTAGTVQAAHAKGVFNPEVGDTGLNPYTYQFRFLPKPVIEKYLDMVKTGLLESAPFQNSLPLTKTSRKTLSQKNTSVMLSSPSRPSSQSAHPRSRDKFYRTLLSTALLLATPFARKFPHGHDGLREETMAQK